MITVAIFEKDSSIRSILSESLAGAAQIDATAVGGWSELRELVGKEPGTVVVLGPSSDYSDTAQVPVAARDFPGTGFILVVDQIDARVLQNAMRSGITDVVAAEDMDGELAPAIERSYEAGIAELTRTGSLSGPVRHGKVISIFGPKGGTGKTVVATNLAVLLAEAGVSTVLLDASVRFGDCAAFLRVRPERTLFDLASVAGEVDETALNSVLVTHDSGLKMLCAPNDPLDAEKLDGDVITRVIKGMRKAFDVIVVDTAPALDDFTLAVLSTSDIAYLVTSLDLPAVKDAKLCLSTLERLRLGMDKVRIVLNRANSNVGFPADEVARALGTEVVAKLPSDVAVPRSVNAGAPVHTDNRKSGIAKDLAKLADDLRRELLPEEAGSKRLGSRVASMRARPA
ncbi:MAG: pilus assembly protein CpaE [Actinomycetota bacterium]|jgi:pilus assembly protein CpaE|nr:pilus assembly protein CpaE [Actinomycetota bacterium]